MGFKRHVWSKYGWHGIRVKVTVLDESNAKIEEWMCGDQHSYKDVLKTIKKSYNWGFDIKEKENFFNDNEFKLMKDHLDG